MTLIESFIQADEKTLASTFLEASWQLGAIEKVRTFYYLSSVADRKDNVIDNLTYAEKTKQPALNINLKSQNFLNTLAALNGKKSVL
ncbi:MAG: hypothetical protein H0V01_09900 [Bacteroidetes bacterium]|nr:hypothetical protein [Bacteroidota bacterium]HET6244544.1 hypothetical protein [Bacteroidia bacterium]